MIAINCQKDLLELFDTERAIDSNTTQYSITTADGVKHFLLINQSQQAVCLNLTTPSNTVVEIALLNIDRIECDRFQTQTGQIIRILFYKHEQLEPAGVMVVKPCIVFSVSI